MRPAGIARGAPPDLNKLRLFAQVAELGSLTKAAAATELEPSAISRQIAALEREWDGLLFHRTGRGLELTELGARMLPGVRALLLQAEQLHEAARCNAGVIRGDVRLGVQASLSRAVVAPLARDLRTRHAGIRLKVFEGSSGQLDEWLQGGYVDLAVAFRYGTREDCGEEELAVVASYLVGPAGDPVTREPTVPFAALDGLPLVLASAPNGLLTIIEQTARKERVALDIVLEANSVHVQLDAVAQGCGYTVAAGYPAADGIRGGLLSASRIVGPSIDRTIALGMTSQRPATMAVREAARSARRLIEDLTAQRRPGHAPGGA
ncbi:LysR family transcriptional regulator [Pigmentiphaga soli]|uniref:LysR family transcriptional regulator n=1 Tax=Pigmentiphaga soli TaxID=1007095 RepID=A0ABP8GEH7_9BURK